MSRTTCNHASQTQRTSPFLDPLDGRAKGSTSHHLSARLGQDFEVFALFGENSGGRDLHAFLEVGKDFSAWMPEQIEAFGFVEGQGFEVCFPNLESEGRGGKNLKEYMISISMAKELAMVQRRAA